MSANCQPRSGLRESVSASELAQMGVCERLVLFEHRYGQRRSAQQRKDMAQGGQEHRRFFREGRVQQPVRKGPCFIATLVYGEGYEVSVLRAFRDQVLCRSMLGRGVILACYRAAPVVCRMLVGHPWLIRLMHALLRPMVKIAARLYRRRAGDD
ncbi:MAG: CFI-box-CTERM domain-containing protein [Azonexus sp.]